MERGGESLEEKKQELKMKVKKLKKGGILVGKRAGPSTPSPIWRLELTSLNKPIPIPIPVVKEFLNPNNIPTTPTVSARKLCATLWEIHPHPHHHISHAKMPNPKSSIFNHNNGPFHLPTHVLQPPTCPPHPHRHPYHQQETASSLRRHLAASLMKHHESVERNGHALQPVSPESYDNSMEVAAYNPAVTPTSSLDSRGKLSEPTYNLKTSTQLLTVLNRIWSLEEQHISDIALVKGLKIELDHSQAKIKELLQEKQTGMQEVDDLMKQVAEEKINRKKEQNRIKAAVQSVKDELEDERKLRKCSESLHQKLARDLSNMKSSFSHILKELERERKARILLENLCDEFAKGIRDYEEEVRLLRHKPEMDHAHMKNADRLILHISEAWLDERMQMKIAETQNSLSDENTILDKLSLDIENFLQAKHFSKSKTGGNLSANERKKSHSCHHSTESFPLNEAISAPQDAVNEEYSTDVDLQGFELNKSASRKQSRGSSKQHGDSAREGHLEELVNSNSGKKKVRSRERSKGHNFSSLQERFSEHMARTESQFPDWEQGELEGETGATKEIKHNGTGGLKLDHAVDDLIRNHSLSSEGDKIHPETDLKEDSHDQSLFTGYASPLQKKSESSLKVPRVLKVNTLKEKLLEARLEAQRSKPSKSSF